MTIKSPQPMQHNSNEGPFGTPLREIEDVKWLREAVEKLWDLLDDVDTADDIAKENDKVYRALAQKAMKKREDWLISDGYGLFRPKSKQEENKDA